MKTGKFLLLSAVVTIAFTACNNEEIFNELTREIQLDMIYPGQESRATDTSFEANDQIGVYITTADASLQLGGNYVNNTMFEYKSSKWEPNKPCYWGDGTYDIYAYYPYSQTINDVENYNFQVQEDQTSSLNYTKSDFMWACTSDYTPDFTNKPSVSMQFAHKMSNVMVELVPGENFEGTVPGNTKVYLYSIVTSAVIDLSSGDVAKDSYAGESTVQCFKVDNDTFKAIVVPQSITSKRPLVEVVIDNVSYLMEGKISYRQGYRHTITVTLDTDPENIKINIGGQLENWGS